MILGKECTRDCSFCAVDSLIEPAPVEALEPEQVAKAIAQLEIRYAVLTSVTRDDLPDGGSAHFANTVAAVRRASPETLIELLIPDLQGDPAAIAVVRESGADVVGHNLETTARLTPLCRDTRASYERSLSVLEMLAYGADGPAVKTALLLGLGETRTEIAETLQEAYQAGARHIAMGQYLAPSSDHTPVVRYWTPEEFLELGDEARTIGYLSVASGPLVRSSYRAEQFAGAALTDK